MVKLVQLMESQERFFDSDYFLFGQIDEVNDRFGLGFGFTHQGESNISNNKPGLVLPDYTRVDFAAYYLQINDEWMCN